LFSDQQIINKQKKPYFPSNNLSSRKRYKRKGAAAEIWKMKSGYCSAIITNLFKGLISKRIFQNNKPMKIEYNNLYTHFIFTTYKRLPVIAEENRQRIEKYITGIISNLNSKLYAIYVNPDHIHFLVSRSPEISEESLATIVADNSERFIKENKLANLKFSWQRSASAFSVSKSDVEKVIKYILNQPSHHKKVTYEDEYQEFLKHYQDTLIKDKKSENRNIIR
jgi:putative transposase